jgi:4-hydroxythreonine-4-phosphate dehydrogenase
VNDEAFELTISAGDPQGIGPEVAAAAAAELVREVPVRVVLVGDPAVWRKSGVVNVPFLGAADSAREALSILPVGAAPGSSSAPSAEGGRAAVVALAAALDRVRRDPERRALVTAPLGKDAVRRAGFADFEGHTGYLAAAVGVRRPLMLFACRTFRVALATVHVPLRRVPELVTADELTEFLRHLLYELRRRYGLASPRIDVLGLNPHAGEGGAFGDEERTQIGPAVAALRADGEDVRGPFPADSYFLEGFGAKADCVVAMYHDQGLVAVKSLAFTEAVNVTLGLPFIRTSPDHGTAYAIAGTGTADFRPMKRAMEEALGLLRATPPGRMGDLRLRS